MWKDTYLENQVMTADPMELIRMLYRAAIDSAREARKHLAAGQIQERSKAINRAVSILGELSGSLDHTIGGDISRNLGDLYAYMIQLLMRANIHQEDAPLAETELLLATLSQGWERASAPVWASAATVESAQVYQTFTPEVASEAHNWSA